MASSERLVAPQAADAGRPAHLVRRERDPVRAQRLHVAGGGGGRTGRRRPAPWRPAAWAASARWRTGVRVPSTLDAADTASSLAPSSRRSRLVRSSLAVCGRGRSSAARSPSRRRASATARCWSGARGGTARRHRPGPAAGGPSVWATRLIDSVALRVKISLARRGGADEAGDLVAGRLLGVGGFLGQLVGAAVHVGVVVLVVVGHRVEHLARLLRGRRRVEEDDGVAAFEALLPPAGSPP